MAEWWKAADTELLHALAATEQKMRAAYLEMLALVAEVTTRRLGAAHGYGTDIDLLRCTQNITRTEARRRIAAAADVLPGRTLAGEPTPAALPATATAVAACAISAEHVTVVRQTLAAVPPHLESARPELETDLAGWARTFDPHALRRLGRRRLDTLDPDGPPPRDTDPTRTTLSLVERGDGYALGGWLDREATATLRTALSPLTRPRPTTDDGPDPRTPDQRHGDALVELARRMLDTATLPIDGGHRPHLTVTVPLTVLEHRLGLGALNLADGTLARTLPAEDARRLACDAHLTPLVLGAHSEPLDIGRSTRTVPRAIRRALAARDRGCAFPGCEHPPPWTDAHHIRHWADGGPTAIGNLALLCGHHHTLIHQSQWEITIDHGLPLFHPPPWTPGGPRRNALHRIDIPRRQ